MDEIKKERIQEVLREIAQDMKNDAKEFDGLPLTGKVVGEYFGYLGAAIATLADIVKLLLEEQD